MRGGGAGFFRRAEADGGAAGDQHRLFRRFGAAERRVDRREIMPVDLHRLPARGLEALELIGAVAERDRPVDGDAVMVEQDDQL